MAGNIKGITIAFNGETTKLDKALREINNKTKSLNKELSSVDKALKFNPSNVDLWRQKQTLLTEKVGETKTKLDALKQAQAQMDAQGVDKNTAEYRDLERQIITTKSQLKTFKKQLAEVGNYKLKALSEGLKQVGDKVTSVGKSLTTHLTVPLAAAGAASVKAFNEVKDALNIVAQKTGATGDALEDMQDSARNLAKSLPTTFEDAATAVGELNTRFGATGDELEDLSEQYIKFAKVNDVDLTNAIDQSQKALSAWGLTAKDAPDLLDALTRAAQQSGASTDTLTEGLIQNGTAFQELGLNMNQSVVLMAQMEKSGANSETVMQGLRKALKNATADGIPFNEALSNLQNTIINGTGSMDGLTAAYDLFGKSGDQIYAAVKNGTLDFNNLAMAADDSKGALDAVFEETLTPAEKFQSTLNTVKDAGYEVGSTLMEVLSPAIQLVADKMQAVSEWWGNLNPKTKEAITKAALIVAAIGPVVAIIGKVISLIGTTISVVNTLGGVVGLLSSGTLLPIIAVIAAVVAAGVLLYKNWDKIKAVAKTVADAVKKAWNGLKDAISNAASAIWDALTRPFEEAWNTISDIARWISNLFPIDIGSLFSNIKLPHISWDWEEIGDTGISVPWFNVDWYKHGGIFDSPSVIGVGEAGSEAVVPLDKFWDKLDNMGGEVTINVYASDGMNVNELALKIEQRLVQLQKQRSGAYGNI